MTKTELNHARYLESVKKNGLALEHVPIECRTFDLCLEAVKRHGDALEFVPEPLKTKKLCLAAVKSFWWAVKHAPEEFKNSGLADLYMPVAVRMRDVFPKTTF